MVSALDLMGLGEPDELARRIGFNRQTVTGVGTAQVGGAAIGRDATLVNLITAGGATAAVLHANTPLDTLIGVYVLSATTGLVFPPSGGSINAAGANGSVNVTTTAMRLFIRISSTIWFSFLAA